MIAALAAWLRAAAERLSASPPPPTAADIPDLLSEIRAAADDIEEAVPGWCEGLYPEEIYGCLRDSQLDILDAAHRLGQLLGRVQTRAHQLEPTLRQIEAIKAEGKEPPR